MADSVNTNDIIALLETMKIWASKQGEEALEYAQSCVRNRVPEYEYREVRSYHHGSGIADSRLDEYLKAGYEFVRASEYIPPQEGEAGYIEYILRRKKGTNED